MHCSSALLILRLGVRFEPLLSPCSRSISSFELAIFVLLPEAVANRNIRSNRPKGILGNCEVNFQLRDGNLLRHSHSNSQLYVTLVQPIIAIIASPPCEATLAPRRSLMHMRAWRTTATHIPGDTSCKFDLCGNVLNQHWPRNPTRRSPAEDTRRIWNRMAKTLISTRSRICSSQANK
jgi:hypothetical protein